MEKNPNCRKIYRICIWKVYCQCIFGTIFGKSSECTKEDKLNVRIYPRDDADILKDWPYLSNGNVVEVLGEVGNGWDYIRIGGTSQGYVYGKTYLQKI